MIRATLLAAAVNLNHRGHYFHWGFILISAANLVVIIVMVALFVAALFLPFIGVRTVPSASSGAGRPAADESLDGPRGPEGENGLAGDSAAGRTWTGAVRRLGLRYLPPGKLLPDAQPAYVASWVYVFGVLTIGALVVVIVSGLVLALFGPAWWHTSFVGHFVNSLHLWSVELFMGFMVIHLWAKFWMAAWRGGRSFTWMSGVICFLVAVFEAFTGYLSQTNFDSQWIAFEAKDGLNSGGIGAYLNTMNFGQALMLHIALIPLALVAIVALHVLLVRVHGVVPPIDALPEHLGVTDHNPRPGTDLDAIPPDGSDQVGTGASARTRP
jgi:quinol-cytochrome oxidoreductase complex cytochrome b subunit